MHKDFTMNGRYVIIDRSGRIVANCGSASVAANIAISLGLKAGWRVES